MKNLTLVFAGVLFFLFSCKKNEQSQSEELSGGAVSTGNVKTTSNGANGKFHIYYATWDEWGRTSRDCRGFGLCNFVDCWFCCTNNNGIVIDCPKNKKMPNAGKVTIDKETSEGDMIIELDPSIEIQQKAIIDKLPLYVDEDIAGAFYTVHADVYKFDPGIGAYGGYRLKTTGN